MKPPARGRVRFARHRPASRALGAPGLRGARHRPDRGLLAGGLALLAITLIGAIVATGAAGPTHRSSTAPATEQTGPASFRAASTRVKRVVISGDSVTESATLDPSRVHRDGLDGALLAALHERGVAATDGYVRAHGVSLHNGAAAIVPGTLHYDGDWAYAQVDGGPDGYSSATVKAGAAVSFPPGTNRIRVLYTGSTPLVYYHRRKVAIAADGIVNLPDAAARVKLVNTGALVLDGIIRYPTRGVSLDVLGHAAALTMDGLTSGEVSALRLLKANQTIILFGTVEEFEENNHGLTPQTAEADFVRGLYTRSQIARAGGGTCVFVPYAPNTVIAPEIQARFRTIEKEQARLDGCTYRNILKNVFGPANKSVAAGLTLETIHPTPAGYRRVAALLARLIVPVPGKLN